MALIFSVFAILFAGFNTVPLGSAVMGTLVVLVALSVVRMSFAAHARKMIATVWLAAYEDALEGRYGKMRDYGTTEATPPSPPTLESPRR